MKKPLVSVIVAAYNEEKNITRLLKSVKKQTYKNTEAIVVDDGSTDNTAKLAKKYTKNVYIRKHAERSVQRNFGVSKAKGKYVLILDADMELSPGVIESCVETAEKNSLKLLIIPEKTITRTFMSKIRAFEREMYMGDSTIEVARFFDKKIFKEYKGYDVNLTGAEDYDLPKRISAKHKIGWAKAWIYHHEEDLTLIKQLKKKYYYASKSTLYAEKHPDLVKTQGNLLFRKAYLRNWRHFLKHPILAISFIFVRVLETVFAVSGFISKAGIVKFVKVFFKMFRS